MLATIGEFVWYIERWNKW